MSAVSLADVSTAVDLASRVEANPVRLAGRALGLTAPEQAAVPGWAVGASAVLVGFTVAVLAGPYLTPGRRRITPNTRVFS